MLLALGLSTHLHTFARHIAPTDTNPDNVIRGLKAAIHNPNASQEAKERDIQRLQEMGAEPPNDMTSSADVPAHNLRSAPKIFLKLDDMEESMRKTTKQLLAESAEPEGGKMSNHVLGGYGATLTNPRTSEGAKQHAEQVLEENGAL
ncbi:hypothetical protein FA13DRAFT_1898284 [Coprinellus micaceus]|uniref:Conidiation protein 6 n=1 Tax=Coprinellus micaceus TaxID=71717 RepID=A0A4Y7SUF7_COPMI|nr:hypothetical protein FA13DRAFT_1898284 [Coprinellus micaceus]